LECNIHHARIMRIYEGSSEIQRNIIARSWLR
jgi:alkylation response protein AidB-like acyl-CoA dehydrogenase